MKRKYDDRIHAKLIKKCQELSLVLKSSVDFSDHGGKFMISVGRKAPIVGAHRKRLYAIIITYVKDGVAYDIIKPKYKALDEENIEAYLDNIECFVYEFSNAYSNTPSYVFESEFLDLVQTGVVRETRDPQIKIMARKIGGQNDSTSM